MKNKGFFIALSLVLVFLLSSCSYPSDARVFNQQEQTTYPLSNPEEVLKLAIETNQQSEIAQKVWFSGWIANNIQKRRTTNMYSGVLISPHGYYTDARLVGIPYRYYKWDDYYYIWTGKTDWQRVTPDQIEHLSFQPFDHLIWWEPFFNRAVQLPNEKILSKDTFVYQIKLSGDEWINQSNNPIFEPVHAMLKETEYLDTLLEQTDVTMTVWIGNDEYTEEDITNLAEKKNINIENKEELKQWITENRFIWNSDKQIYTHHLIYQYQAKIQLPIPGAGYMDQEIYFRFYKYDDPGISIQTPEEMEKYIK